MSTFERTRTCFTDVSGGGSSGGGWISAKLTSAPASSAGGAMAASNGPSVGPGVLVAAAAVRVERLVPDALAAWRSTPCRASDWRRWRREIVESKASGAADPASEGVPSDSTAAVMPDVWAGVWSAAAGIGAGVSADTTTVGRRCSTAIRPFSERRVSFEIALSVSKTPVPWVAEASYSTTPSG